MCIHVLNWWGIPSYGAHSVGRNMIGVNYSMPGLFIIINKLNDKQIKKSFA
jgi:hypothetical protein